MNYDYFDAPSPASAAVARCDVWGLSTSYDVLIGGYLPALHVGASCCCLRLRAVVPCAGLILDHGHERVLDKEYDCAEDPDCRSFVLLLATVPRIHIHRTWYHVCTRATLCVVQSATQATVQTNGCIHSLHTLPPTIPPQWHDVPPHMTAGQPWHLRHCWCGGVGGPTAGIKHSGHHVQQVSSTTDLVHNERASCTRSTAGHPTFHSESHST